MAASASRLPASRGHFDLVSGRHAQRGQSADAPTAHAGTARGEIADGHLGVEAADRLDQTGRGAGVEAVLVVQRELDGRRRCRTCADGSGCGGALDAEEPRLDQSGLRRVAGDLAQRRPGGGQRDRGD